MILEIITIIIIFIVMFLFIFLLIGLNVNVNLNKRNSDFNGIIEVKWIFFTIFSKNFPDDNNKDDEKVDKSDKISENENDNGNKDKNKTNKNRFNEFKTLIPLIKYNIADIFDLVLTCITSIKLEMFNMHISLGLSSPVDTVNVVGYIWAFSSTPNLSKNFHLSAEPVFIEETTDFNSEIVFKINLLRPVGKLLRLMTKKTMIKLVWNSRKLFKND